ncbi:peptidyl-prolyl cis-trans isomerase CYP57-like isoform X2 [Chenopodium quinoa]|uniref:PPIase cyclophilin-type domain-containing protein n=1 Tax=Chenopodium quinoa TaxID=63459 RepID=A0A803LB72_CHEQI|nr:peptidyl-prolyl cis-trans isomerase CYP57-like isoform X2 [Chenopodium quinoa]
MSTIYVLEPPTKGKVVIHTTYGPIDIELWPKEAPKAVRNFVQLCLEGYYDSTIFHRIIKGFLIQGGDPTSTGLGGESIYGAAFSDEFHSRLRFNHRGLVACANAGSPHTNGSQFFMTLDRCDWLDKKNTIFGKVTGDSIYNLLRIGEVESDKDDRPLDPAPKITSVEVIWNPFEDIVPREISKKLPQLETDKENKDLKKKPVKKLNLLSFGEEAEEDERDLTAVKQKIKSSHDVLDDPRLLKEHNLTEEMNPDKLKSARDLQLSVREALNSKNQESLKGKPDELSGSRALSDSDEDEISFDGRMREQILRKRMEIGDLPTNTKQKSQSERSKSTDQQKSASRSDPESSDDQRKVGKLSIRKKGIGSEARAVRIVNADTDLQLLNNSERERLLQKQKKRRLKGREDDVLAKLERFKNSMAKKHVEPSGKSESGIDEDLSDWKTVHLKFAPEPGKNNMSRSEDANDYAVIDPLLEKGKQKFNRMIAKEKRREREWAGRSLT